MDEGQRVGVLLRYGCWQEVVAAPAERVLPLPDDVGFEAGAALGLNYMTALFALASHAHAQAGETLVVHGAAGGVGTAAIQIGRALGLRTIRSRATTRSGRSARVRCARGSAGRRMAGSGRRARGRAAVDIVFDPVGDDSVTDSIRTLAPDGRLLVLGFAGGEIPTVKVTRLLLGNRGVLGAASLEYFEQRPARDGRPLGAPARVAARRGASRSPRPAVLVRRCPGRAPHDRRSRSQRKSGAEQAHLNVQRGGGVT